jgi:hypothetical protein
MFRLAAEQRISSGPVVARLASLVKKRVRSRYWTVRVDRFLFFSLPNASPDGAKHSGPNLTGERPAPLDESSAQDRNCFANPLRIDVRELSDFLRNLLLYCMHMTSP